MKLMGEMESATPLRGTAPAPAFPKSEKSVRMIVSFSSGS
jgi:hypothetical protein